MRLLMLLALAAAAVLLAAPVAAANTYFVHACKTRLGTPAPIDGFTSEQTALGAETRNSCATGGSLSSTLIGSTTFAVGARASWHYTAPPDTQIRQFELWRWGRTTHNPQDIEQETAQYTSYPGPSFITDRREWCNSNVCSFRGVVTDQLDNRNYWPSGTLSNIREVWFSAGCFGPKWCAPRPGAESRPMAEMHVQAVQIMLVDDHVPAAGDPSGALLAAGPHAGVEGISFAATDRGSGLLHALVEVKRPGQSDFDIVERQLVDANGGRCAELDALTTTSYEYGYGVPCRLSADVEAQWDTTTVPDGEYELRVRLEDAAGNRSVVAPARTFVVDNVPPPAATVAPGAVGAGRLGSTLVGELGQWTGADNEYASVWLRCVTADLGTCEPIPGAVDRTYDVVVEDLGRFLRFQVTAANVEGTTTAASPPVGPVTNAAGVVPECADGADNDADAKVDTEDPECSSREGNKEAAQTTPQGGFNNPIPTPAPTPPAGGGAPAPDNGTHASRSARMTATGARRRFVGFGQRVETTITLRDPQGRPISGAVVLVLQRMSVPGATFVPAHQAVRTDARGRIPYSAPPGFSRTLRFAYKAHQSDDAFTATHDLVIGVRSKTTFRVSDKRLRNGDTLRFRGRVLSRPLPRAGVFIDLQAQVGSRWQTFRSVRTNAKGAWRSKYTFRSTSGLQTYVFRARVRDDTGFPYAPSISARRKVMVRG
jgi:hypothetical protein